MIAKLHRFYGPAPTSTGNWLDVPEWLFQVYNRAQPRIEAEEHQLLLKTTLAGSGHMEDTAFQQYQRQLIRQATGGEDRGAAIGRPRTPDEMRMLVRQLGLSGFKVDITDA